MTLLGDLLSVYESNEELAGKRVGIPQKGDQVRMLTLLPPMYTEVAPTLVVPIDEKGQVVKAGVSMHIRPADQERVLVPATIKSIVRTSHLYPHLISDQLRFVLPQLAEHTTGKTAKNIQDLSREYIEQLEEFITRHPLPGAQAIYASIVSGNLFESLRDMQIFQLADTGQLRYKVKKKDRVGESLSVLAKVTDIVMSYVQFQYWPASRDPTITDYFLADDVIKAVQDFSLDQQRGTSQHSLLTGESVTPAADFPKSLIIGQANAKLISANDENNYAGYFQTSAEGASIGGLETLKSLNALRWLIRKQGIRYSKGQYVVLLWTGQAKDDQAGNTPFGGRMTDLVPPPYGLPTQHTQEPAKPGTGQRVAAAQRRALQGQQRNTMQKLAGVHLLELRVATSGRISIANYQTMDLAYWVDLINGWYHRTAWLQVLSSMKSSTKLATPSPAEIVQVGLGIGSGSVYTEENAEAIRYLQEIVQCIRQGRALSRTTATQVVRQVVQSMGYSEKRIGIPWQRALEVACAVWRNYEGGKARTMLDEENRDRSYLFGRLLALADQIEGTASYQKQTSDDNARRTNAFNLMQQFSIRPFTTWNTLMDRVHPYLGGLNAYSFDDYQGKIANVMGLFQPGDYNDDRLTPNFLMGYYLESAALIDERRTRAAAAKAKKQQV
ncbi:type I-C CRISPR-associated protein Cas8c/Csd1 [Schleiferilactobacillus harbinensis]|jgi:CRISPR-associated protein Csd1|uniref:type I-C CRISPR-associated protein Cas8c/Csd1 n=1 Tax=Schleiferilactobacillus harbinensis TaxID=304207 RepID=UPI0007B8C8D8|nr:type I-C CRISPR-associated protein Cas8c/Csd1 [Schleiferilactobacillus harbinensis]